MTVSEKKLFREETLTLQTARQIATTHEAARQNMNLFRGQQQTHDSATVNKVMKVKADKRVSPRQCSTKFDESSRARPSGSSVDENTPVIGNNVQPLARNATPVDERTTLC